MKRRQPSFWPGAPVAIMIFVMTGPFVVPAATRYVWQDSPNPGPPHATWLTAAHTIQDAVDVAQAGETVLVTNGLYAAGGRVLLGTLTNRVVVDRPIVVQSVNGPEVTIIQGFFVPSEDSGESNIRCVYLTDGAVISGFTLTKGATRWEASRDGAGGGILCESTNAVITNCTLTGNSAFEGGGVWGGMLHHCTITFNNSDGGGGGGASGAILNRCTLAHNRTAYNGGGAKNSTLAHCTLTGNQADRTGGGAADSTLSHCTLTGNYGSEVGGGAEHSTLNHCTLMANNGGVYGGGAWLSTLNHCMLIGNRAYEGGGAFRSSLNQCTLSDNEGFDVGGGASEGTVNNCIVYYNTAPSNANHHAATINFSCTIPLSVGGTGNITNEPAFVNRESGDVRLRFGSPCIDGGTNLITSLTNDLDGNLRPLDGNGDGLAAFDMGAYEYNPQTADSNRDGIPDWWILGYRLDPNDPAVAAENPDLDAHTTFEEWVADTDPTNAVSCLRIDSIAKEPPVTVHFRSSSNRLYTLTYATSSADRVWTDVPGLINVRGLGGTSMLRDTNAFPARYYRLRANLP